MRLFIVLAVAFYIWLWAGHNEKARKRLDRLESLSGITKPCEAVKLFPYVVFECPK